MIYRAMVYGDDDYHRDIEVGDFDTSKQAQEAADKEYSKLDANEKLHYFPTVLIVK